MDPALKGVVWVGTSKEARRDRPALDSDLDVDLAVVGGGFCGLSTALHAAAAGLSVAVIEAGIVGSGASGRNGGFVVPQFPGAITPSAVRARLGAKKGAALVELVAAGPDAVMAQIARYQIACDAQQNGWIQPARRRLAPAAISAAGGGRAAPSSIPRRSARAWRGPPRTTAHVSSSAAAPPPSRRRAERAGRHASPSR